LFWQETDRGMTPWSANSDDCNSDEVRATDVDDNHGDQQRRHALANYRWQFRLGPADWISSIAGQGGGGERYFWFSTTWGSPQHAGEGYHINAVDIVTQWELAASAERISEAYLLPVIGLLLEGFPFNILGFHSDSGSEYLNHETAKLLEKLRIEFTRSRPRQTSVLAMAQCFN
jgi:transposase InsO family protein